MALAELIAGCERLIITLQEIQVVKPFGKAVQFLLNRLFSLAYSREIEIAITRLQLQTDFLEIVCIIFNILLYVLIQVTDRGISTVNRKEFSTAQSFVYSLGVISHR